jgi:uncharacterized protein (TIGR02217 family)
MNNTPFLESPRFPESLSYQSRGGPRYSTAIVSVRSGVESRNQNWTYPLHIYDAAKDNRSIDEMEILLDYFHVCAGMYYGFRFKDWADYKSASSTIGSTIMDVDQVLGTGDGVTTAFQLRKGYTTGSFTRYRKISKPVAGTVIVALDAVPQSTGWTVDNTTGIITFATAPANNALVTAGFEFDVPVRFASDEFAMSWVEYGLLSVSIPLQEIRL